ncbi:S-(hydroxymethyl)glutathione synthase [Rhizobium sp. BK181]|uniref:S-(hydroxymethyl)glutathione synthase n=1 Tax=Rhizobium sp. BK181 TaxID=2587072 RepID=UPI00161F8D39|nr:S-(hydroxymethyl)glutathione synthase [Rhizobium sp. BK181]MBB3319127.1 S-(hydroxymethyl)glutathione synthase [Rhizobium sp. BK181]
MPSQVSIHPVLDGGVTKGQANFSGGTLVCACTDRPVKVAIKGNVAHNHACGCTKCWKPKGAVFSVVAVTPHENVSVLENGDKLQVVDPDALILRHACKACGVHMYGPVERDHAFKGLDFIHPERFQEGGWAEPTFAAFVSSIIESGTPPSAMAGVRGRLNELGLTPYDCLNPTLMDVIATWVAKKAGTLREA